MFATDDVEPARAKRESWTT